MEEECGWKEQRDQSVLGGYRVAAASGSLAVSPLQHESQFHVRLIALYIECFEIQFKLIPIV